MTYQETLNISGRLIKVMQALETAKSALTNSDEPAQPESVAAVLGYIINDMDSIDTMIQNLNLPMRAVA